MKSNRYGSRVACWARWDRSGGIAVAKLVTALTARAWSRPSMCNARTSRLHPRATATEAYQDLRSEPSILVSKARWWYHGNCASGACTIASFDQAAANARMYLRLRGEYPVAPRKRDLRSVESRSMTLLPQPS